jgi:hypothetical protein
MHKISMVSQVLANVAENPVHEIDLTFTDPDNRDDAEEINSQLCIVRVDQHGLINFLADLLNNFEILDKGSVPVLT